MVKTIAGSDGLHLRFMDEESYREYKRELELVNVKAYKRTRDEHGIWAGNQNKFVDCYEDMNEWDTKDMERLYNKYYDE